MEMCISRRSYRKQCEAVSSFENMQVTSTLSKLCCTRKRKMHRRCTRGGRYLRVKREIAKLEPGEELALDALDELQIAARDGHLVRVRLGLGLSFELGLGFSFLLGFGLGLV